MILNQLVHPNLALISWPYPLYATFTRRSFVAKLINHLHARVQLRIPPLINQGSTIFGNTVVNGGMLLSVI